MRRLMIPIIFVCSILFSSPVQASLVQVTFSGTIDSVPSELASNPFFETGSQVSWTITVDNEPTNIGTDIARYSSDNSAFFSLGTYVSESFGSSAAAYLDILGENYMDSGITGFAVEFTDELFLTNANVELTDSTQTAFGDSLEDRLLTDLLDLNAFDTAQFSLGFTSLPAPPDTEIVMLVNITDIAVTVVPVPAAVWFLLSGLVSLTWLRKSHCPAN